VSLGCFWEETLGAFTHLVKSLLLIIMHFLIWLELCFLRADNPDQVPSGLGVAILY
jgi:hypothetical protein